MSPKLKPGSGPAKRPARQRRLDLAVGILIGVVLGLGVIAAFVFLGSEGSIDAPRISKTKAEKAAADGQPRAARQ